jgi:putative PIN family toxin of toxin-antitoxin system
MIVVIDTNVLLPALCATHVNNASLRAWARGQFTWALTTEVLLEYQEIAEPRIGERRWQDFLLLLERVGALRRNVMRVSPTFRFHLVIHDPDDNKFADCAIVAEADYVITEDRHFDSLIGSGHKPQPITPGEFIRRYLGTP